MFVSRLEILEHEHRFCTKQDRSGAFMQCAGKVISLEDYTRTAPEFPAVAFGSDEPSRSKENY